MTEAQRLELLKEIGGTKVGQGGGGGQVPQWVPQTHADMLFYCKLIRAGGRMWGRPGATMLPQVPFVHQT